MIKVNIVCVGKLKEAFWREGVEEYAKRLSRFCKLEMKELPEKSSPAAEADEILSRLSGHIVALAVEGKQTSSEGLAKNIKTLCDKGEEITFVIGSSCGLDDKVKAASDELLSFSQFTFPHQMMRVILLEQIYRAFMINSGATYHK